MGDLLVFERIEIKSHKKNYSFSFEKLSEDLIKQVSQNSFLFIDSNVDINYPIFRNNFEEEKIFVIEATENNKTLQKCQNLLKKVVDKKIKKNHKIVAVGGGIVQDITGFVCSILYRGIEWEFFPTTLLSQADSCIGSKTSINFEGAKNLLGTFHPPNKIYCCVDFLQTLKKEDIKSGIGEILHYYLIDDNSKVFDLMNCYDEILNDSSKVIPHIYESLKIKKKMIEIDEFDQDQRRIFNYGHTFGHAIETITNYKIPHGQAVTLGIDMANYISYRLGVIDGKIYKKINKIIQKNIPKFSLNNYEIDEYMKILSKDKKNKNNSIVCILLKSYGQAEIVEIDNKEILKEFILDYFKTN
jgi:3-dehydroquinate synthase